MPILCLAILLLGTAGANMVPMYPVVQPGQQFTIACTRPDQKEMRWDFEGLRFNSSGANVSAQWVTCLWGADNVEVTSLQCKTRSGSWIQKVLPDDEFFELPASMSVTPLNCSNSQGVFLGGEIHIGVPPEKPTNLSCLLNGTERISCRWDVAQRREVGDAYHAYKTEYKLTILQAGMDPEAQGALTCSVDRGTNFCDFQSSYKFLLKVLNVTVEARNVLGVVTTSVESRFPIVTRPLETLNVVNDARPSDGRTAAIIVEIDKIDPISCGLYQYALEIQHVNTRVFIVRLQLRENTVYRFWKEWKRRGHFIWQERRQYEDFKFWDGAESRTDYSCSNKIRIPVPGNTTVAVRGRLVSMYSPTDIWSSFSEAKVIRSLPTTPPTPKLSVLWVNQEPSQAKHQADADFAVVTWGKKTQAADRRIPVAKYVFGSSCSGLLPNVQTLQGCNIRVAARNLVGDSKPAEMVLADRLRVREASLIVINSTCAQITFEINCADCTGEEAVASSRLDVFFWPVSGNHYSLASFVKQMEINQGRGVLKLSKRHSASVEVPPTDNTNVVLLTAVQDSSTRSVAVKPKTQQTQESAGLQTLTVPIHRFANSSQRKSFVRFNFRPYEAYRFALAVRSRDGSVGAAKELQSAYYFATAAPESGPSNLVVDTTTAGSVEVTWRNPEVSVWRGVPRVYKIYIFSGSFCRGTPPAAFKHGSCKSTCPNPLQEKEILVGSKAGGGEEWKITEADLESASSGFDAYKCLFTGLDADKIYYVRVSMWNENGEGPCGGPEKISWSQGFSAVTASALTACAIVVFLLASTAIVKRRKIQKTLCPAIPEPAFPSFLMFDDGETSVPLDVKNEPFEELRISTSSSSMCDPNHEDDDPNETNPMINAGKCENRKEFGAAEFNHVCGADEIPIKLRANSSPMSGRDDVVFVGSCETVDSRGYTTTENALKISISQRLSSGDSGVAMPTLESSAIDQSSLE